jgi:hypothetical protein
MTRFADVLRPAGSWAAQSMTAASSTLHVSSSTVDHLPSLSDVLNRTRRCDHTWQVALWFNAPSKELRGLAPREWMHGKKRPRDHPGMGLRIAPSRQHSRCQAWPKCDTATAIAPPKSPKLARPRCPERRPSQVRVIYDIDMTRQMRI